MVGVLLVVILGISTIEVPKIVTVTVSIAAQVPVPQVAVYLVVIAGVTVIVVEVAPVFHTKPLVQFVAVKTTDVFAQTVSLEAVTTGSVLVLIIISWLVDLKQLPVPHETV
jgi:hypothetical protein